MTEAQWLACKNPRKMLNVFQDRRHYRDRKLRLFAVGCCLRIWDLLDEWSRNAVEVAERIAEGRADHYDIRFVEREWQTVYEAWRSGRTEPRPYGLQAAGAAACFWPRQAVSTAQNVMQLAQEAIKAATGQNDTLPPSGRRQQDRLFRDYWASLLRCIFGNPFRPSPALPPAVLAWSDGTVRRIAEGIYEERKMPEGTLDAYRLAILADALLDAGCDDEALMQHCRSDGPHVRGCWALDLILEKAG
jgi:hypothetical protein